MSGPRFPPATGWTPSLGCSCSGIRELPGKKVAGVNWGFLGSRKEAAGSWGSTFLGLGEAQKSAGCGALESVLRTPGDPETREPFPGGPDPSTQPRAACSTGFPGAWMPWNRSGEQDAPLTPVPFLQGCAKSRSLNNIAGAAGISLGLSPLASRYSSPYPPRKLLLSHPFPPLTSPAPRHSAP